MIMTSERTSRFRLSFWILAVMSFMLNVAPLAIYAINAVVAADLVYEKVALSMTVFIVLIMTLISIVNKIAFRSRLWIALIGIYICIDSIMTPLIIIAVCQIIDELIISPLKKNQKNKLIINKEMDKRSV
jgi:hypothetical protein